MLSHDFLQMGIGAGMTLSVFAICGTVIFKMLCEVLVEIIASTSEDDIIK